MDLLNIAFVVLMIALILKILAPSIYASQSISLHKKFVSLGNMTGKSYDEICKVVGSPSISQSVPDGFEYTWSSPRYAIKLKFNQKKICLMKLGEVATKQ